MARPARPSTAPAGPLRLRGELGRTLTRLDHLIEQVLERPSLEPEAVHDLHRDLRRLVSGLAVWRHLVPSGAEPIVADVTPRLKRLARLVGRVRDRDVTAALLVPAGRWRGPPDEDRDWTEFLGLLRDDTHTGRELLRAFLRTERQAGLFERIGRVLEVAPRADASRGLHRILAEERRRRQGRVRKAHRRARRRPDSERLHRLRIRIRQWRHFAALELVARATTNHPPPPSWQRLQGRLGRLHDLDVALATIPESLGGTGPVLRLREKRRDLRRSVRRSLERIAAGPARATARFRAGRPR